MLAGSDLFGCNLAYLLEDMTGCDNPAVCIYNHESPEAA
jgi:hypothetical protein